MDSTHRAVGEKACLVFSADGRPDDELVDVIELIPVLVSGINVSKERLKLWPSWDAHVERLGSDEGIGVEKVEVVEICEVRKQLSAQPVQVRHDLQQGAIIYSMAITLNHGTASVRSPNCSLNPEFGGPASGLSHFGKTLHGPKDLHKLC